MEDIKLIDILNEVSQMDFTFDEIQTILENELTDKEAIKLKIFVDYSIYTKIYGSSKPTVGVEDGLKIGLLIGKVNEKCGDKIAHYNTHYYPTKDIKASDLKSDYKWLLCLMLYMLTYKNNLLGIETAYDLMNDPKINTITPIQQHIEHIKHILITAREYNELIISEVQTIINSLPNDEQNNIKNLIYQFYNKKETLVGGFNYGLQ